MITNILLSVEPITNGQTGELISVPVLVSDLSTLNITAFELAVKCDASKAKLEALDLVGSLTEDWMSAFNNRKEPYNSNKAIAVGASAYPAKSGSVLLYFKVRLLADTQESGPILIMPIYFMLNETLILGSKPTI